MKNITVKMLKNKVFGLFAGLFVYSSVLLAQEKLPFQSGEQLDYSIHYKYGIMMVKAGTAQYAVKDNIFRGNPVIRTSLIFRTTGVVDAAFKVRDTLIAYSTPELVPVFHCKHLHEGKTHYTEEMDYKKFSETFTSVQSKKYMSAIVKFDTLLTAKSMGFDMLSIFVFVRSLNYTKLKTGDTFEIASFVGKETIPMHVRYMGQIIFDKGSVKYKTLRFEIDIVDHAFEDHKTAMEIWIGDDKNHLPIRLKAKLKIGAAEAVLISAKNLKYAFDSKIEIKK